MAKAQDSNTGKNKERDWVDILTRLSIPLMAGLLIAWAGYISEKTLSSISSREESARLITELQVKREQAETDLRKDVFDQALQALLKKNDSEGGLRELSKQMLRLEMLALNFGDSLSLSPLFNEFRRDLSEVLPQSDVDRVNFDERAAALRKRLTGLAKRLASTQVSSLIQHGVWLKMLIPLPDLTPSTPCGMLTYTNDGFKWPADEIRGELGHVSGRNDDSSVIAVFPEKGILKLDGKMRRIKLMVTHVNHCNKSARVNMSIWPVDSDGKPYDRPADSIVEVERDFQLDFFNFPMVDNTRLAHNQRFSLVMEDFRIDNFASSIEIVSMIFPAEYASVKDRPGMKEALELLNTALKSSSEKDTD
jgi:hypothetical protein